MSRGFAIEREMDARVLRQQKLIELHDAKMAEQNIRIAIAMQILKQVKTKILEDNKQIWNELVFYYYTNFVILTGQSAEMSENESGSDCSTSHTWRLGIKKVFSFLSSVSVINGNIMKHRCSSNNSRGVP